MKTAKIFQNGKSQAVRLPKEFRLEGKEVFVKRVGNAIMLIPMESRWDSLLASLDKFPPDFMVDRDQPPESQERENYFD